VLVGWLAGWLAGWLSGWVLLDECGLLFGDRCVVRVV
jgi:hypothetical protein